MKGILRTGLKGSRIQALTKEEIEVIHESSLRLLQKTGVLIHDDELLKLLDTAGCGVDSATQIAQLPGDLIEDALARAPDRVRLCGRDKRYEIELGAGTLYARTPGGPPHILDLETQRQRESTIEDVGQCTRVADALPNIHGVSMFQCVPRDVPTELIDIYAAEASFNNTQKPLFYVCHNESLIELVLEMAATVVGGEEMLRKRPLVTGFCEVTSPLRLDPSPIKVLKTFASRGLPLIVHSHPIAGFSSPVTLAGEVTLMNAETLAAVTIAQLIRPGAPIIYGTSASVPEMRTVLNLAGAVEGGLLGCALAQMAQRYHLPSSMTSGIDAKTPDAQASMERILTALPPILAGIDLINLSTIDTKLTFSLEQLVIDNELLHAIARLLRGIVVDEEHVAVELIEKVGHRTGFLTERHTIQHFREELLDLNLVSRESWGTWESAGSKTLHQKAREEAIRILREHRPQPLSEETQQHLTKLVESGCARVQVINE